MAVLKFNPPQLSSRWQAPPAQGDPSAREKEIAAPQDPRSRSSGRLCDRPLRPRAPAPLVGVLKTPSKSGSMPDVDICVGNAGDDQDYRERVHRHIVSGMVADLIGDRERCA